MPKQYDSKKTARKNGHVYAQGFEPEPSIQVFLKEHPAVLSGLVAVLVSAVIISANYGIYSFQRNKTVPQPASITR